MFSTSASFFYLMGSKARSNRNWRKSLQVNLTCLQAIESLCSLQWTGSEGGVGIKKCIQHRICTTVSKVVMKVYFFSLDSVLAVMAA